MFMGNSQEKKTPAEPLVETVLQSDNVEVKNNEKVEVKNNEKNNESDQVNEQTEIPLSSIPVNDKNGAFQLLIAFINLAYSRGAFKQDEVEKIIECINKFVV